MSTLVWVMADGEHQDMVAVTCTSDGRWLAIRWDWREAMDMFGTGHDTLVGAEEAVMDWTRTMENAGSKIIAGPLQLDIPAAEESTQNSLMIWWDEHLRPAVLDLELKDPADMEFDSMVPPPAGSVLAVDPYRAKLSWGP